LGVFVRDMAVGRRKSKVVSISEPLVCRPGEARLYTDERPLAEVRAKEANLAKAIASGGSFEALRLPVHRLAPLPSRR
jgi:hypothetical protein